MHGSTNAVRFCRWPWGTPTVYPSATHSISSRLWPWVSRSIASSMGRNGAGNARQILSNNTTSTVVKKTHPVKNTLMVDGDDRRVQSLSGPYGGRVHDTRIGDEEDDQFPPCGLFQDTRFQGDKPDPVATYQPKKKPQGKELTDEEKTENTMRASMRILVEHVIAGVKRC